MPPGHPGDHLHGEPRGALPDLPVGDGRTLRCGARPAGAAPRTHVRGGRRLRLVVVKEQETQRERVVTEATRDERCVWLVPTGLFHDK